MRVQREVIGDKGGPSYPFVDRRGREFPTGFTKLY